MIRHGQRRHAKLGGALAERIQMAGAIQDAVRRVNVQMNKGRFHEALPPDWLRAINLAWGARHCMSVKKRVKDFLTVTFWPSPPCMLEACACKRTSRNSSV
jgi:hypothetical protein